MMTTNGVKRRRIQVTLSQPMLTALEYLADQRGLPPATMATMLLRSSLDRTINSAPVQERIKAHNAGRTAAEWRAETQDEWQTEEKYSQHRAALAGVQS